MSNPNYQRGVRFERQQKKNWEEASYIVTRASGSHGPFDLVCIPKDNDGPAYLIQCKVTKREADGLRMAKNFRANPPLLKGRHLQVLNVKVTSKRNYVVVEVV